MKNALEQIGQKIDLFCMGQLRGSKPMTCQMDKTIHIAYIRLNWWRKMTELSNTLTQLEI